MTTRITTIDTEVSNNWYGDRLHDYDISAIDDAYVAAIEEALPEGLSLQYHGSVTANGEAMQRSGLDTLKEQVWAIVKEQQEALGEIAEQHRRSVAEAIEEDSEIIDLISSLPDGYRVETYVCAEPQLRPAGAALIKAEAWIDTDGEVRVAKNILGTDERGNVEVEMVQDSDGSLHCAEVLGQADTGTELFELLKAHDPRLSIWDEWGIQTEEQVSTALGYVTAAITGRRAADLSNLSFGEREDLTGDWSIWFALEDDQLIASQPTPRGVDADGLTRVEWIERSIPLSPQEAAWVQAKAGETPGAMTQPEFVAYRRMTGLTGAELAQQLGVNERTVRDWAQGRQRVPGWVADRMCELASQNRQLADEMLAASDGVVVIPRKTKAGEFPPDGWYLQAAAVALSRNPDLTVEWK